MVAEVIINRTAKKLNRTFDYNVPQELQDLTIIGSKVLVPFGKSSELEEAFVVGFKQKSEYEIKDIVKIEDNLNQNQIELARWMAKRYFCNVSDCIKLMLAPGTRTKEKKVKDKTINAVYLKKDIEEIEFELEAGKIKSEKQKRIINFIKDNEGATVPEIEIFTDSSRTIVNTLVKNGYLEILEKKVERNPLEEKKIEKSSNLVLTNEQQTAYRKVANEIEKEKYKEFLLYGITRFTERRRYTYN